VNPGGQIFRPHDQGCRSVTSLPAFSSNPTHGIIEKSYEQNKFIYRVIRKIKISCCSTLAISQNKKKQNTEKQAALILLNILTFLISTAHQSINQSIQIEIIQLIKRLL